MTLRSSARLAAVSTSIMLGVAVSYAAIARTSHDSTSDLEAAAVRSKSIDAEPEQERDNPPLQRFGGAFRLAGLITTDTDSLESGWSGPGKLISDAPPEAVPQSGSVIEFAQRAIDEFRRLLGSTGLNVARLFPQLAAKGGEGGPFVAPPKADRPDEMTPDRLEAMRRLLKSLPLAVPLEHYQLESRFGRRHDPFNRRLSFHTGIDLSGPYMSPVFATAAGVVTYAGYRSDYGKVVIIDHGNSIATLYAHLHRFTVSVGQNVAEHAQIGFLGSTGRSTGPHVHYEVLVNDEPQDPEKFIGLSRVLPAAE